MNRRPSGHALLTILALSIAILACSRLKGGGSSGADAAPQSSSEGSPWASNGADVTRFSDEVPFGPDAIIARDKTEVRRSPDSGEVLATLSSGTDVVKLSTHARNDLVMFDDPMDAGLRLMGWVPESALSEPATPPTPNPTPTPIVADEDAESPSPSPPSPSPSTPGGGHHHHHPHGPPKQH